MKLKYYDEIYNTLRDSGTFLIVPKTTLDIEIPMSMLALVDEETSEALGHASMNVMGTLLPNKFFVPTTIIDDRYVVIRWSFDENGERQDFIDFMEATGLTNMREVKVDGYGLVEHIDFTAIGDNQFLICPARKVRLIPPIEEA